HAFSSFVDLADMIAAEPLALRGRVAKERLGPSTADDTGHQSRTSATTIRSTKTPVSKQTVLRKMCRDGRGGQFSSGQPMALWQFGQTGVNRTTGLSTGGEGGGCVLVGVHC